MEGVSDNKFLGMLIIWAKVSDIFGRKIFAVTAIAIFTIFSGACGAAQSMTQLYARIRSKRDYS